LQRPLGAATQASESDIAGTSNSSVGIFGLLELDLLGYEHALVIDDALNFNDDTVLELCGGAFLKCRSRRRLHRATADLERGRMGGKAVDDPFAVLVFAFLALEVYVLEVFNIDPRGDEDGAGQRASHFDDAAALQIRFCRAAGAEDRACVANEYVAIDCEFAFRGIDIAHGPAQFIRAVLRANRFDTAGAERHPRVPPAWHLRR